MAKIPAPFGGSNPWIDLPANWREEWWKLRPSDVTIRPLAFALTAIATIVLSIASGIVALAQSPFSAIALGVTIARDTLVAVIQQVATTAIGPILTSIGVAQADVAATGISAFVVGIIVVGVTVWVLGYLVDAIRTVVA